MILFVIFVCNWNEFYICVNKYGISGERCRVLYVVLCVFDCFIFICGFVCFFFLVYSIIFIKNMLVKKKIESIYFCVRDKKFELEGIWIDCFSF